MKTFLLNSCLYSVYVRNHGASGTFADVTADLTRIAELGATILWLMPIHPIGKKARKGALGSPYAIADYRRVNPEYGTLEDFRNLVERAHELGLKVLIDVVYNHTSPDSVLWNEHPEWFFRKPDGSPGNRVGDWSDIIDLDFSKSELQTYLIDSLKYWLEQGVDGFRCDVAPLIPLDFWIDARKACDVINPGAIWLTESVEPSFIHDLRSRGHTCHSDAEMYRAFDVAYDYDTYEIAKRYFTGRASLNELLEVKRIQGYVLPADAIKLRFVENHDQPRAAHWFPEMVKLRNWTAFSFFEKGCAFVYGGQEAANPNLPDLFDRDPVNWDRAPDHAEFIKTCAAWKNAPIMADGWYTILDGPLSGVVVAAYGETYDGPKRIRRVGIFNLEGKVGSIDLGAYAPELEGLTGEFENLAAGGFLRAKNGLASLGPEPVVFDL